MTKEDLQAIGYMMDEKFDKALKPIYEKLETIEEDVKINRHSCNLLLKWAERAERSVNVGLYEDD